MEDILRDKLVRRKVDTGCLDPGKESKAPAMKNDDAIKSYKASTAIRARRS